MRKPLWILRLASFGLVALSLAPTGCLWKRPTARVFIPPAEHPGPRLPETPTLAGPPDVNADIAAVTPPELPSDLPPELEAYKPKRAKPAATAPPKPAIPTAPAPDLPDAPKLRQMFTPQELAEYNRELDATLERVKKVLETAQKRRLNKQETDLVNRIRTFQKQAEQVREQDPVTAVSLARRADLLAKDLRQRLP